MVRQFTTVDFFTDMVKITTDVGQENVVDNVKVEKVDGRILSFPVLFKQHSVKNNHI
jgi:hypothetical protein